MLHRIFAVLAASLLLASGASADYMEVGDAGDSVAGAQLTTGGSPLQIINGSLGAGDFADVFVIKILDPSTFVAEVMTASFDSKLALFDAAGNGIGINDDGGTSSFFPNLSRLDGGIFPLDMLVAGTYLLGISVFGHDPFDGVMDIFEEPVTASCPDKATTCPKAAGAGVLTSYSGAAGPFGSIPPLYSIALKSAAPVPEPSAAVLFGLSLGVSGLAVRRKR